MDFKWLDANYLRQEMSRAGLFIFAFELLKDAVIDGVKNFYTIGFGIDDPDPSPEYEANVLTLDKHLFEASLLWLRDNGAIDGDDIIAIQSLRELRNQIAHNAPELFSTGGVIVTQKQIVDMAKQVRKIDNYWGRHDVEIMLEPDKLEDVNYDGIVSIRAMILGYMIDVLDIE